ncbi:MAG: glycosyltransferase [Cytophagales bacterium]|nr:glycosyltransferase [Cytophagales bacterium]
MKIVLVSTFGGQGGAAIAMKRLGLALSKSGHEVNLLIGYPKTAEKAALYASGSFINQVLFWLNFYAERLFIRFIVKEKKHLFKFSLSPFGLDITNHPLIRRADIVHLHWVNFGFLNLDGIRKLCQTKPVVWTLHDMWAFTGGCHYSLGCVQYEDSCHSCFYLRSAWSKVAQNALRHKERVYDQVPLHIITCSAWLATCARSSRALKNAAISVIGNPIDVGVFKPMDRAALRKNHQIGVDDFVILFGAMDASDERKGAAHLDAALGLFKEAEPRAQTLALSMGKSTYAWTHGLPTQHLGPVNTEAKMADVYNLADVFVLPSQQDNLPNMVLEALACGVPVVCFDSGGVVDMVDHGSNGYIVSMRNPQEMAAGIRFFRDKQQRALYGKNARLKIEQLFTNEVIAEHH